MLGSIFPLLVAFGCSEHTLIGTQIVDAEAGTANADWDTAVFADTGSTFDTGTPVETQEDSPTEDLLHFHFSFTSRSLIDIRPPVNLNHGQPNPDIVCCFDSNAYRLRRTTVESPNNNPFC